MRNLIKLILGVIIISSCSCRQEIVSENEFKNDCYFHNGDVKPFSGQCVTFFNKTHVVKAKRMFKEGLMDGPTVVYYNNGSVLQKGCYKNGKLEGKWKKYYSNGNLEFEITHKEGKLCGDYATYYENGELKEKGTYDNNKRIGEWQYFDKNGELTSKNNLTHHI